MEESKLFGYDQERDMFRVSMPGALEPAVHSMLGPRGDRHPCIGSGAPQRREVSSMALAAPGSVREPSAAFHLYGHRRRG
jgi:hypothetical protein